MKIALFGGSFDPIHEGHLQIAKYALKRGIAQEVWFLPSYDAPLKDGQCASFKQRLAMIALAIYPFRRKMKVLDVEGRSHGKSYTYDTLVYMKQKYPQHEFCFLIGSDQALAFNAWYRYEELFTLVDFYVFSRMLDVKIDSRFKQVSMPLIEVSSTKVRAGYDLYLVPKAVRHYIAKNYLYLEERVKARLNEKRYLHSKSVADLCVKLAKAHHLDEQKAYVMGILHDICKYYPFEHVERFMIYHESANLLSPCAIWHGFQGAYEVKHTLEIYDKDIYQAIYHHVLGDGHKAYDKILFISDKLDPLRGYDISKQLALSLKDLDAGFKLVKEEQQAYLKKE